MEPEIHSNLPNASPLIAYGEARGPWMNKKLLAILAGSLVVCVIGTLAWFAAMQPVEVPADAPLLIAVNGGVDLPASFPNEWRSAVKQSRTPVLVGVAQNGADAQPFIIKPTWRGFVLVSDHPITRSDHARMKDLLPMFFHLLGHSAYASITIQTDGAPQIISGPLDGSTWMTDAKVARASQDHLPSGDMGVDLAALPESWPPIKDALARSGFVLNSDDMPSALGWTMTTSSLPMLELRYSAVPSTSTLIAIAAATGLYDAHPYTLEDGTVVSELRLPFDSLNSTRSASGTALHIDGNTVFVGEKRSPDTQSACSTGQALIHFSPAALQNVKSFFPVLASFQLNQLDGAEIGGKLAVCFQ